MDYYDEHLDAQLDERGDLAPPWVKFPCLERYSLGWRMGGGESWLCFVSAFLRRLGEQPEVRRAWLRRHPPAPITWADWVAHVLGLPSDDLDVAAAAMKREQLVADDAAFSVYCSQTDPALWPWQQAASKTPAGCARYATRDLAFWSRHHENDHFATAGDVPAPWAALMSTFDDWTTWDRYAATQPTTGRPGCNPSSRCLDWPSELQQVIATGR